MKKIVKPLGKGKTFDAVNLANETDSYLVVMNQSEATRVMHEHRKDENFPVVNRFPITFDEFLDGMKGSWVRNVVIDNVDYLEQRLLSKIYDNRLNIIGVTRNPCEKEKEIQKLQKKLELTEKKVEVLNGVKGAFKTLSGDKIQEVEIRLKKLDEQIKGLDPKGEKNVIRRNKANFNFKPFGT